MVPDPHALTPFLRDVADAARASAEMDDRLAASHSELMRRLANSRNAVARSRDLLNKLGVAVALPPFVR